MLSHASSKEAKDSSINVARQISEKSRVAVEQAQCTLLAQDELSRCLDAVVRVGIEIDGTLRVSKDRNCVDHATTAAEVNNVAAVAGLVLLEQSRYDWVRRQHQTIGGRDIRCNV